MSIRSFFIPVLFLIVGELNAQSEFKPGYVIMNTNDTTFGEIDKRGDFLMNKTCRFKPENSESILTFSPSDIVEFRFVDGKCYVSRILESGTPVFLEYLIKGELNIYYYKDGDGYDIYFVDKKELPLKEIPFKEEIRIKDDGTRILYQSKYHIGLLQTYTNDADGFKLDPDKMVKPDHNNLIKFAEDYHHAVCPDEKCIIYGKNIPSVKVSFELIYGVSEFNKKNIKDCHSSEAGLNILVGMPRISERFYIKTGLKRCQVNYQGDEIIYTVIPIQVQYQYSHFKLVPKAFFGFNNYLSEDKSMAYSIAPGIGLDYQFSKRFSVTSSFTTDFVAPSYKVMSKLSDSESGSHNLLLYSVHVGLKFDL